MLQNKLLAKIIKKKLTKKVKDLKDCKENKVRSVAVYYSGGGIDKRKYRESV